MKAAIIARTLRSRDDGDMEKQMANITKRRKGELIRMLFQILKAQPEGMRASDALGVLASRSQWKQATTSWRPPLEELVRHAAPAKTVGWPL